MHIFRRLRATSARARFTAEARLVTGAPLVTGARRIAGARLVAVATFLLLAACGSRGSTVPDLTGDAADILVTAALDDLTATDTTGTDVQPLMIDSISFGRLGTLTGDAVMSNAELQAAIRRDVQFVDAPGLLDCPPRRPCRLEADGVYITLWDAALTDDVLTVTVSRVRNVDRLYTQTEHATWQLELRRTGTGWRLIAREPVI